MKHAVMYIQSSYKYTVRALFFFFSLDHMLLQIRETVQTELILLKIKKTLDISAVKYFNVSGKSLHFKFQTRIQNE